LLINDVQSDGEEPTSPVGEVAPAEEVEVSGETGTGSGGMSVLDALKGKKAHSSPFHSFSLVYCHPHSIVILVNVTHNFILQESSKLPSSTTV